jgi:hypothetical protein
MITLIWVIGTSERTSICVDSSGDGKSSLEATNASCWSMIICVADVSKPRTLKLKFQNQYAYKNLGN